MQQPKPPGTAPTAVTKPVYQYKRKYRPLDVRSWHEGFLRLIGWILVIVLSVVSGGLFVVYERMILNVHDGDFRDLYFDQRLTNQANNRYHKNFLLAESCCNTDAVYFPYGPSCVEFLPDKYESDYAEGDVREPFCKPLIVIECNDIRGSTCNSTRSVVYAALGMTPTGQYENCMKAGRLRVGSQVASAGRASITLVARFRQTPMFDPASNKPIELPISFSTNVTEVNVTEVNEFLEKVLAQVNGASTNYIQPNNKLSSSASVNGVQARLVVDELHDGAGGIKAPPPWKAVKELFGWPAMGKRCQNSEVWPSTYLRGQVSIVIPQFNLDRPQEGMLSFEFANDTMLVPAWNLTLVGADGDEVGATPRVRLSYLTGMQFHVGQAITLGPCGGWRISREPRDRQLDYSTYWTGNLTDLSANTFGPFALNATLRIIDVAGPRRFQLPFYAGTLYIFSTIGMGGIWMFSNGLILFVIILVWWNIRSNRGLPPIIYRYMQKYRGW